ncbi:MTRF1L release factor glutamine methyltransferase [Anopheles bellator]|uniref:MTRF1L release factor glutamine methyltransferase n=1 Tax=Anopheles bellator TaxID=139047 RepID=UPI00264913DA|nr:MTRF1L release factor glutamine methyltransferase [Anopheles bellator]XP_058063023.1 MTRF1L release factor glutamine methyltransferase [Anopheles bellator]
MINTSRAAARLRVTLCASRLQPVYAEPSKALYSNGSGGGPVAVQTTFPTTVRGAQEKWTQRFRSENIPEPETSITNIIAHVLQLPGPADVDHHHSSPLDEGQISKIEALCQCRLARMPLQYIIREWDFRDLTLKMVPPVFIPRPETEELVELILQQMDTQKEAFFLEIGCGTGAISLSLLKHAPKSSAIAIDQNRLACELTQENAASLGLLERLRIFKHKLINDLPVELADKKFDMIVSNPPYIPSVLIPTLEPEVKVYEDLRALDGGSDGLTVIKAILRLAARHLVKDGILWLEVDCSHPPVIEEFLTKHGQQMELRFVASYKDLFQKDRFVEIVKC